MSRWFSGLLAAVVLLLPLAPSPALAAVRVNWGSRDVIPSTVAGVRADAEVRLRSGILWTEAPPATFVLRNAAGTVVESRSVPAACPQAVPCFGEDEGSEYVWTWNGRRSDGTLRPAGRYTLTATAPDGAGGTTTEQLGSTYIRHLASVRGIRTWSAGAQSTYARAGRCSSVVQPGTRGWAGSVGLLSLSRCRSTAGSDDLATQTFAFTVDASTIERVTAWRLDAYGAPVRSGMRATLHGLTPRGWQRSAVLGAGLGWHNGTTHTSGFGRDTSSSLDNRTLTFHAQARATNGNRYDIKYLRTVLTYRAWVR